VREHSSAHPCAPELKQSIPIDNTDDTKVSELLVLPQHEDPGRRGISTRTYIRDFQRAIGAPAYIPQPVIAAIHGPAFGLALDALGAVDVRWAAADVAFSIKEVDVGLAADLGTFARLPKLVGNASLLHELALSGRVFGAEEAVRLGLVSRVVAGSREEVVGAALEFAAGVARKSPIAVTGIKRFIAHALEHSYVFSSRRPLWDGLVVGLSD